MHPLMRLGGRCPRQHVKVGRQFAAVLVLRQVVDVGAKGVLNLAADALETEDNVRRKHGPRDGEPPEKMPQLHGQQEHVDPGHLSDGDAVGYGDGRVGNALKATLDLGQVGDAPHCCALVHAVQELLVRDVLNVGREIGQNLQGEITQVVIGSIQDGTWVFLAGWNAQVLSSTMRTRQFLFSI